jgi:outer membrane murein-binding lipoprotein Lpp
MSTPPIPAPQRIIDLQLPLPWLLSSVAGIMMGFAGIVWAVSSQTNKLDQLITSTAKLEKRVDERDSRVETMKDAQYEARRQQDLLEQRVANLERGQRK